MEAMGLGPTPTDEPLFGEKARIARSAVAVCENALALDELIVLGGCDELQRLVREDLTRSWVEYLRVTR